MSKSRRVACHACGLDGRGKMDGKWDRIGAGPLVRVATEVTPGMVEDRYWHPFCFREVTGKALRFKVRFRSRCPGRPPPRRKRKGGWKVGLSRSERREARVVRRLPCQCDRMDTTRRRVNVHHVTKRGAIQVVDPYPMRVVLCGACPGLRKLCAGDGCKWCARQREGVPS